MARKDYTRREQTLEVRIILARASLEGCEDDYQVALLRLEEAREKLAELEA